MRPTASQRKVWLFKRCTHCWSMFALFNYYVSLFEWQKINQHGCDEQIFFHGQCRLHGTYITPCPVRSLPSQTQSEPLQIWSQPSFMFWDSTDGEYYHSSLNKLLTNYATRADFCDFITLYFAAQSPKWQKRHKTSLFSLNYGLITHSNHTLFCHSEHFPERRIQ